VADFARRCNGHVGDDAHRTDRLGTPIASIKSRIVSATAAAVAKQGPLRDCKRRDILARKVTGRPCRISPP
jgi:hypothetical protein